MQLGVLLISKSGTGFLKILILFKNAVVLSQPLVAVTDTTNSLPGNSQDDLVNV